MGDRQVGFFQPHKELNSPKRRCRMYRSCERAALLVTEQLDFQKIERINMDVWPSGMSRTQYRLISYTASPVYRKCETRVNGISLILRWNRSGMGKLLIIK
jgi:hypothetical protein